MSLYGLVLWMHEIYCKTAVKDEKCLEHNCEIVYINWSMNKKSQNFFELGSSNYNSIILQST